MKKETHKTIHAINNMLATIVLSADFLLRGLEEPLTKQQKKHIKDILVESKRIKEAIKNLGV